LELLPSAKIFLLALREIVVTGSGRTADAPTGFSLIKERRHRVEDRRPAPKADPARDLDSVSAEFTIAKRSCMRNNGNYLFECTKIFPACVLHVAFMLWQTSDFGCRP
jgi:hypothetical protein